MDAGDAVQYEQENVHNVYQDIAQHFSDTRYKPWPLVSTFLESLAPGSIGADIGCGNGKYLGLRKDIFIIGSDRSEELVKIASARQNEVCVADALLSSQFPAGRFDFAISIAVTHHFSTKERRVLAIKSILGLLRPGGRALIYVWALEQRNSRRGYHEGQESGQDVMVPWVTRNKVSGEQETHERYYHLYREGELNADTETAGGTVVDSGYERDNWWAIITDSANLQ